MDRDIWCGMMEESIKESFWMIKDTDKGFSSGEMEGHTKDNG